MKKGGLVCIMCGEHYLLVAGLAGWGGGRCGAGGLAARVLGTLHKNRTKSLFSPTKDHIKDQKPRKFLKEESPNNLNPECECPHPL